MTRPEHTDPRRRFLDRFADHRRSAAANLFLAGVRAGRTEAAGVLAHVEDSLGEKIRAALRWGDRAEYGKARDVLDATGRDSDAALDLARWALEYEALSPEAKAARKAVSAREGVRTWMQGRPPSERQLTYLRALGYVGACPATMAAASDLIEQVKRRRRAS